VVDEDPNIVQAHTPDSVISPYARTIVQTEMYMTQHTMTAIQIKREQAFEESDGRPLCPRRRAARTSRVRN